MLIKNLKIQLLKSLWTSGTLTANLYYPAAQEGSAAPRWTKVSVSMTSYKILGAYQLFQAVLTPGTSIPNIISGYVDVNFGTTQTSVKVKYVDLFATCSNNDLETC